MAPCNRDQPFDFGPNGAGNDAVPAEARDGSGTDNGNFSTPVDGQKPRMQMYLWTGAGPSHEVVINSPAPIKTYGAMGAQFGPALSTTGITGSVVTTNPADGCTTMAPVTGKVARIDRGTCAFTIKVKNAQLAGTTGVVMANNTGAAVIFTMGGTDAAVTIPSVMISQNDGVDLRTIPSPNATERKLAVQPLQPPADQCRDRCRRGLPRVRPRPELAQDRRHERPHRRRHRRRQLRRHRDADRWRRRDR